MSDTATPCREVVVIGASAGALEALFAILPALPADYPRPILLVVHLPTDKENLFPGLLGAKCRLSIREAEDKDVIRPGHVYIAPPDYHLLLEADGSLSLSTEKPVLYSRPSIDVLFESAADAFGEGVTGIVLTGASEDGAQGLKAIVDDGGRAVVQHPDQAAMPVMPRAALSACPSAKALSLPDIARYLQDIPSVKGHS